MLFLKEKMPEWNVRDLCQYEVWLRITNRSKGRQGYTFIITFVKTVFVNCSFYLLIIFSHRVRMEVFTEQFNMWNEMKLEVSVVGKKT